MNMEKWRILIVDENESYRNYLSNLFDPIAIECFLAEDNTRCLYKAMDNQIDLVIIGPNITGGGGIELTRRIKTHEKTLALPVIIIGFSEEDQTIEKAFQTGVSAYITKNKVDVSLVVTVENILTRYKMKQNQLILIVDDSRTMRHMVKFGLSRAGYQVMTANNGKEALESIKNHQPHLVLTDINMPVMNGFELCEALYSNISYNSIPVIVMSTRKENTDMKRMLQMGAASYIVKPFMMTQLQILIERILSEQYVNLIEINKQLKHQHKLLIEGYIQIADAIDAKFTYYRRHSRMVSQLVGDLLNHVEMSKVDKEMIILGSRLMNIGYVGIPETIFLNENVLTKNDMKSIKNHPWIGASFIQTIPKFETAIDVILYHHERYDGNGYLSGRKEDNIPLGAQITSVSDTYVALTNDRPYRKKMSSNEALDYMNQISGTQLSPQYVSLLSEVLHEG